MFYRSVYKLQTCLVIPKISLKFAWELHFRFSPIHTFTYFTTTNMNGLYFTTGKVNHPIAFHNTCVSLICSSIIQRDSFSSHQELSSSFDLRTKQYKIYISEFDNSIFRLVCMSFQKGQRVIIPLRAKRVGEFIEIGHKKISPTGILSTLGCLSLCNSVTL